MKWKSVEKYVPSFTLFKIQLIKSNPSDKDDVLVLPSDSYPHQHITEHK